MTDTNDMRRDFEACCRVEGGINTSRDSTPRANGGSGEYLYACTNQAWWAWQAATERATAIERERCAMVCYFVGGKDTDFEAHDCAAAIRKDKTIGETL